MEKQLTTLSRVIPWGGLPILLLSKPFHFLLPHLLLLKFQVIFLLFYQQLALILNQPICCRSCNLLLHQINLLLPFRPFLLRQSLHLPLLYRQILFCLIYFPNNHFMMVMRGECLLHDRREGQFICPLLFLLLGKPETIKRFLSICLFFFVVVVATEKESFFFSFPGGQWEFFCFCGEGIFFVLCEGPFIFCFLSKERMPFFNPKLKSIIFPFDR